MMAEFTAMVVSTADVPKRARFSGRSSPICGSVSNPGCRSLFCTCFPDIRGCDAIQSAEKKVDIGEIASALLLSDDPFPAAVHLPAAQHPVGACEAPPAQHS